MSVYQAGKMLNERGDIEVERDMEFVEREYNGVKGFGVRSLGYVGEDKSRVEQIGL